MNFLSTLLITWYRKHKRSLPWRETRDIYKVWLSEVILQQTRVEQGLPYYYRFLEAFPTVFDLAKAPQEKVLKTWEGLGYYSRARNLHAAAKWVVKERGGKFPTDYEGLLELKGIGPYTAAAISSFCFEEAKPVTDGNVFRFLTRLFGIRDSIESTAAKQKVLQAAEEMMSGHRPSEFNQAIMEFGALYCKPRNPDCPSCIFQAQCYAGSKKMAERFPVKKKKAASRDRFFYYFLCEHKGRCIIRQRTENDIWKGLFEFPMQETDSKRTIPIILKRFLLARKLPRGKATIMGQPREVSHILSHQNIHCVFIHLRLSQKMEPLPGERSVSVASLNKFAMPRLLTRILSDL